MSTRGWVFAVFLTMTISLVVYAKTTEEADDDYAYFRAYHVHGCVWYSKGETFEGERVVDVLKNMGGGAPFITTLREEDIPRLLNFFNSYGWQVVSHSSSLAFVVGRDDTRLNFTCILKRK